jgi:Heterokaryon incompatibility protein (HET)
MAEVSFTMNEILKRSLKVYEGQSTPQRLPQSRGMPPPSNDEGLCKTCNNIDLNLLRFQWPIPEWIPEAEGLSYEAYPSYELGPLSDVLHRAAKCSFCNVLCKAFNEWTEGQVEKAVESARHGATIKARMMIEGYIDQEQRPDLGDLLRLTVTINLPDECEVPDIHLSFQACDEPAKAVEQFCESESTANGNCIAYGGRLRPILADCRLFQRWMAICDRTHGERCHVSLKNGEVAGLRFVDVEQKCIVEASEIGPAKYLALSYVWGKASMLRLTTANIRSLTCQGALDGENVPLTISDAMLLTKRLAKRYLWVDSLCILQDDETDVAQFIPRMNTIYSQALLTIVAAAGDDANSGLPGLHPGGREKQVSLDAQGVSLLRALHAEPNDFDHYLSYTTWNSRGWTMQERALSRRALIFTSQQVYWECEANSWCEEANWEITDLPKLHRAVPESNLPLSNLTSLVEERIDELKSPYRESVMQYTQRQFSFESDVLDAFEGILSAMHTATGDTFFWALPESIFSSAICWYDPSVSRRTALYPLRSDPISCTHIPFPSWSWLGWLGIKLFPPLNAHSMEIVFYRFDDSGNIVTVKQTRTKSEIPDDGAGWDYEGLRSQWKNSNQTIVSREHLPNSVTELAIAPTLLFFWTSSCRLRITYGDKTSTPEVRDRKGSKICQLRTNLPASFPDIGEEGPEYEFIVISRDLTVFQPMLCIMLILMEDGIAYRQTLVQIKEQDWIAQEDRVWKLFMLG